jgi:tetratricopeptide (TPR) repeat protein
MAENRIGDIIDRDWATLREDALDRALERAPDSPEALATLINMYAQQNEFAAAERTIARAGRLEAVPDPLLLFQVGIARIHAGRASDALPLLERAQLLDPDQFAHFKRVLGTAQLFNGRTEEALAMYERAWGNDTVLRGACSEEGLGAALVADDPRPIRRWLIRAQEFHEAGKLRFYRAMEDVMDDQLAARAVLRETFENPYEDVHDPLIALWAAYHGDYPLAVDATLRTPNSWWIWHPLMAPVRNEPPVRAMLNDLGLVEYWREYGWGDFCRPAAIPGEIECH